MIFDAISSIKRHEGFRETPYRDSKGILTIGHGINLENGITERESSLILEERVRKIRIRLPFIFPFWKKLSHARQDVLIEMAYNLGNSGLLKFKKMIKAMGQEDYESAADEMLDSVWAYQVGDDVGQRAYTLSVIMRAG